MASVPDPPSVPSAERERRIKKTNQVRRLKNARNWKFESISLQRRVGSELGSDAPGIMESGAAVGIDTTARTQVWDPSRDIYRHV